MKKILIECGHTLYIDANTGIQRVVRNIILNLKKINDDDYEIILVKVLNNNELNELHIDSKGRLIKQNNLKIKNNILRIILSKGIFLKNLAILKKYKYILEYKIIYKIYLIILESHLNQKNITKQKKQIKVNDGDIFITLDSTWSNSIINFINDNKNIKFYPVLYDLIPYFHPNNFEIETINQYTNWWNFAFSRANGIFAISDAVIEEVKEEIKNERIYYKGNINNIVKLKMGSLFQIDSIPNFSINGDHLIFLMVGTLEPRKNHLLALNIFEKLWNENFDIKLIIVGKKGWKIEDTYIRIINSEFFNKNLILLDDCDDVELLKIYINSDYLLQCSTAEGFGLPLLEAKSLGLPIVCSDLAVFQEVLGESAFYFKSNDNYSLEKLLRNIYKNKKTNKKTNKTISWLESAEDLINNIKMLDFK